MAAPASTVRTQTTQTPAPQPIETPISNQLRGQLQSRTSDPVVGGLLNVVQQMEQDRAALRNEMNALNGRISQLSHDCPNCCVTKILCQLGWCTSAVPQTHALANAVTVQQPSNQQGR